MNYFKNTRVVVTGGRGFIGTNLVNDLKAKGADVCIYDITPDSEYIKGVLDSKSSTKLLSSVDLRTSSLLDMISYNPHYIFHLAADVGGIQYLLNNQNKVFYNNAKMILNVLDAARQCKDLRGFVFPSSACIYPKAGGRGLDIFHDKKPNPHSSYGWSKLYGEMLVKSANIPATIVRLFNVYGPYDFSHPDSHVVPSLITKVLKAKDRDTIEVYGSGRQSRAFVYVDDIVSGLEKAVVYRYNNPGIGYMPIFNLGTRIEISIKELIKKIILLSGKKLEIFYDKSKPEGEYHRSAEIINTVQTLNWYPKITFDEGLYRTYEWAEKNVKI